MMLLSVNWMVIKSITVARIQVYNIMNKWIDDIETLESSDCISRRLKRITNKVTLKYSIL